MSKEHPMFELLAWEPQNPYSTSRALNWLRTQPNKEIIGYIQIDQQRPHQITYKNRHTWEMILFDFENHSQQLVEIGECCGLCGGLTCRGTCFK